MTDAHKPDELLDFDKLWDYGNPAATEEKFRALVPDARARGDSCYLLQLLTQIARAQGLARKPEEAHRTLDEVEHELADAPPVVRVRYLLERGRALNSYGSPDRARPLFLQAWDAARDASEHTLAVDAAHMMAIVEPPDKAITWNERAMAYVEASGSERAKGWLGSLYNNLGWTYHDRNQLDRARGMFEKCLEWNEERKRVPGARIARWSIGKTERLMGKAAEALAMQRDLLAAFESAGEKDGYVFEEIGECLLALNRSEDAAPYFASAHAILSADPWLQQNEPERLKRLSRLAASSPKSPESLSL